MNTEARTLHRTDVRWRPALASLLLAVLPASTLAGEGGIKHEYIMRGQVLEADAGAVVICVGEADGAKVGQVLQVVRHVRVSNAPKQAGPRYRREPIGSIRITGLFDGHYADAKVVEGEPRVNDTATLEPR